MNIVKGKSYFSDSFKWTFLVFSIIISGYIIFKFNFYILSLVCLIVNLLFFSSKYYFSVDTSSKQITDGFKLLGVIINSEKYSYNQLQKIALEKERMGYSANTRSRTRQVKYNEYHSELYFDGDNKLEIDRSIEYKKFYSEQLELAEQLKIPLEKLF